MTQDYSVLKGFMRVGFTQVWQRFAQMEKLLIFGSISFDQSFVRISPN